MATKKPGRPKMRANNKRSVKCTVYLSNETAELIDEVRGDLERSEWLRGIARSSAEAAKARWAGMEELLSAETKHRRGA